MGKHWRKHWRKYNYGIYWLGELDGEAVVKWRDFTQAEGRSAVDSFARRVEVLTTTGGNLTVGAIFRAYVDDRAIDGKLVDTFRYNWIALGPRFASMQPALINAKVCRAYAKDRVAKGDRREQYGRS
jgi:hypothetical protein